MTGPIEGKADSMFGDRRDHRRAVNPDFPWLDPTDPATLSRLLSELGVLEAGEVIIESSKAGDGNMNLTLRVRTHRRTFIVKQARPWVERYVDIDAPWNRILFEAAFYEFVQRIPQVTSLMPRLLCFDAKARVLVLEDCGDGADASDVYHGALMMDAECLSLAGWLAQLHEGTYGAPNAGFDNLEMRRLNRLHMFEFPLDPTNGLDLESRERGLSAVAASLRTDSAYMDGIRSLSRRYLDDGPCLLHGDFFPGSWLRTPAGVRVIDPEFCFFGDAEFDLGIALGHLLLADQPQGLRVRFYQSYVQGRTRPVREDLVARYAAVEVMRRILGVAQVPLMPAPNRRTELLELSRKAMIEGQLDATLGREQS